MSEAEVSKTTLKIGAVAAQSGVSIETLRFYEKTGVLDKPQRTGNGYRVYDGSVLDRLAFIKRTKLLGFTLGEIREIISEARHGQDPCEFVRSAVGRKLRQAEEMVKEIRRYRKELAKVLREWDKIGDVRVTFANLSKRAMSKALLQGK
jgi:DNA-binding transcriptional MerR regulator